MANIFNYMAHISRTSFLKDIKKNTTINHLKLLLKSW